MPDMERNTFQVGTFEVNCSIVSENGKALVVDPGAEATRIRAELKKRELSPAAILLTHAHFDHVCAVPELQRAFPGLPVFVGGRDMKLLTHPLNQFLPDYLGVKNVDNVTTLGGDGSLEPAAVLQAFVDSLGWTSRVEVIETPGHTPGGVCYLFSPAQGVSPEVPGTLLSGDTLFCGSVGRTDFPGGSMPTLQASLEKLKVLPGETVVVPGHGAETTIAREVASNPFLQ